MINKLILAIKTAGLNHKQIADVLIGDRPEQTGDLQYPLLRVWANGSEFTSTKNQNDIVYKFVVAVADRHQDNSISALEAISDSDLILIDILSTLQYMYRADRVVWEVTDSVERFYDSDPDVVAGGVVTFRARVPYTRDFCAVPSNDFDFPAVGLMAVSVIDEGYSDSTYTSNNIINGGIA